METFINWNCGDFSGDGHGKAETYTLKFRYPAYVNIEIFVDTVEDTIYNVFGINIASWFLDYADNKIPAPDSKKLKSLGFIPDEIGVETYLDSMDEEEYSLHGCRDFLEIWMFLVNKINPDITVEEAKVHSIFTNGGYGLFE